MGEPVSPLKGTLDLQGGEEVGYLKALHKLIRCYTIH